MIAAILAPSAGHAFRHWLIHLGGIGFIPLGILDGSIVPVPGSMDLLTIILAGRDAHMWVYYALMATLGSVLGGYITYHLARKGGKEALSRRISATRLKRINKIFHRAGFLSIAIPAMLPPPMPMTPFVLAAGAFQYPAVRFILALTLGRSIRYMTLAYLATLYGRQIRKLISTPMNPVLLTTIVLVAVAGVGFALFHLSRKPAAAKA